ncbi:hypothetical protein ILYODFUR_038955 [Ilyodon furcidens]|uniref:Uncharacterized protein n=1 Tax=Ilyodon furcidens TaxID=33524 RepID=A0ABV0VKP9_9TELE
MAVGPNNHDSYELFPLFQASGNSLINERSKNSVHFPDVRSSVLLELSGKEGQFGLPKLLLSAKSQNNEILKHFLQDCDIQQL